MKRPSLPALVQQPRALLAGLRARVGHLRGRTRADLEVLRPEVERAEVAGVGLVDCPFCAEPIRAVARKCRHFGEYLDSALRAEATRQNVLVQTTVTNHVAGPNYGKLVAGVLSVVPGLGHVYNGRFLRGVLWFGVVAGVYVLAVPAGLGLHLVCIVAAIAGA